MPKLTEEVLSSVKLIHLCTTTHMYYGRGGGGGGGHGKKKMAIGKYHIIKLDIIQSLFGDAKLHVYCGL